MVDHSARSSLDLDNFTNRKSYRKLVLCMGILLGFLVTAALCVGRYSMNPADIINVISATISCRKADEAMKNIFFLIRLPRVLAALLIGAALTLSGAAYQSTFRNPLISPDLLGVSSGASMGAATAIFFGFSLQAIQFFAFTGGILAVLLATSIPKLLRNSSNLMLVLSGVIVSGFMNALIGVLKFISKEQDQLSSIVFWQMGSLARVNARQLASVTPSIIISMTVMLVISWRLNILSFGEQEAQTVGINVPRLRGLAIISASLLTASSVCVSGTIGWIGLIIPHFGRLLCGSDNTKLMPVAALLGGAFLLIIDTLARTLTSMEIPLSILSGLAGAPMYVWLLSRQRAKIL